MYLCDYFALISIEILGSFSNITLKTLDTLYKYHTIHFIQIYSDKYALFSHEIPQN
jgi:hypothetical protein